MRSSGRAWLAGARGCFASNRRSTGYISLLAHEDHTILALNGRQRGVAPRMDLPATKGLPPRRRLTASRDSSRRIVRSPTSVFSLASSVSQPSVAQLVKRACPPATKWPRHAESVAAVMSRSRDTRSSSSPRNNRKTASPFFREDNHPRSALDSPWTLPSMKGGSMPQMCVQENCEAEDSERVCRSMSGRSGHRRISLLWLRGVSKRGQRQGKLTH